MEVKIGSCNYEELAEMVKSNPNKIIKYTSHEGDFTVRAQYKEEEGKFLILHSDDSGGLQGEHWAMYGGELKVIEASEGELVSRYDEMRKEYIESISDKPRTSETLHQMWKKGHSIIDSNNFSKFPQDLLDADFPKEAFEKAWKMSLESL